MIAEQRRRGRGRAAPREGAIVRALQRFS